VAVAATVRTSARLAAEILFVKFRIVWHGPVNNPPGRSALPEEMLVPEDHPYVRYELHGSNMVRWEEKNHRRRMTPIANFSARIVRDIVFDDGMELKA
jgi:hypothetical protein